MKKSNNLKKYQTKNPVKKVLIICFIKQIIKIVKKIPNTNTILDIGCGEGFIISKISKTLPKTKIEGLDISNKSLNIAKNKLPSNKFYLDDISKLKKINKHYDLTLVLEVLEHLDDQNLYKSLDNIKKITNNYCLISVPLEPIFSILNLLTLHNIKRLGKDKEHIQFWNKKTIYNIINKYFDIIFIKISFPWIIILGKTKK